MKKLSFLVAFLLLLSSTFVPVKAVSDGPDEIGPLEFTVISSYTSTFNPDSANRSTNIILSADAINGTVLKPGDEFSFNRAVGPRTADRGYKSAQIISGGKYVNGIGGGICQVSGTLFNAAVLAGMEITERRNHGLKIGYLPDGRDATVSWGTIDLRFRNTADAEIIILISIESGVLEVRFVTYDEYTPPATEVIVTVKSSRRYEMSTYISGELFQTFTSAYSG